MTETIENLIQLLFSGICMSVSAWKAYTTRKRMWVLLGFAGGAYFLMDLYWELFVVFYSHSPKYSSIPDIGAMACYIFLIMIMHELRNEQKLRFIRPRSRFLWLIPVFTAAMTVYFLSDGFYIEYIIEGVITTVMIWEAVDGLLELKEYPEQKTKKRMFYIIVLLFSFAEYSSWTASSIWDSDDLGNPYYWFDTLLSVTFLLFPLALRKESKE